uniref:Glyco_hydro_38C domain-containing protein n=1 Tax=Angiostrongylus cantonensis TaxID=6313 RepID=A0A0K0DEQ2_ANGCA
MSTSENSSRQLSNVQISAEITLNGTLVVDAQLTSIHYITITAENYTNLLQEFRIDFKNEVVDLEMGESGGYERGNAIYATKGNKFKICHPLIT